MWGNPERLDYRLIKSGAIAGVKCRKEVNATENNMKTAIRKPEKYNAHYPHEGLGYFESQKRRISNLVSINQ